MTRSIGSLGQNRVFVIHISSWWIHRKRELGAGSQQHLQRRWRVEDIIFYAVLFGIRNVFHAPNINLEMYVVASSFPPSFSFCFVGHFEAESKLGPKRQETRTSTEDSPALRGVLFRCEAVQTQGDHGGTGFFGRLAAPFLFLVSSWCFSRWWFERVFFNFCPCLGKWSKFDSTWYFSDGLKPPIQLLLPENERELVSQTYTS